MSNTNFQVEKAVGQLRDAGSKIPSVPYPYPLEQPVIGDGVSETEILALQNLVKTPIPDEFLEFQKACGSISAMDVWNGYILFNASKIHSLMVSDSQVPIYLPSDGRPCLPIGADGGGNFFLLTLDDGLIWKWKHETSDVENVSQSFIQYLQRILEDWQHFIAGDNRWKYLSG